MLQHLYIKDLAIVAFADITFSHGMTAITGETGAGKSILLEALNLILGERCDNQLIRSGSERAEIAATFDISNVPGAILWLTDCELTGEPPQQCIIRRILYTNGRSRAFINGRPSTTQQLRLLGEHLIQMHGQHQHQLLLKTSEQLRLLDAFGQHQVLLSQVKTAYSHCEKIERQKLALKQAHKNAESHNDLLQYQLAELEACQLGEQELITLYQEHDKLAHAQNDIQYAQRALALLENEEKYTVLQQIANALLLLRSINEKSEKISNASICLENGRIQLQEAILDLQHFINHLDVNALRLAEIEQRLEKIHELARKHKVDPLKLYLHYQQLQEKAQKILDFEQKLIELDHELFLAKEQYQHFAQKLTGARELTCQKLAQAVTKSIQQLAMPGSIFTIQLTTQTENLHPNGNETVIFEMSANPGHPPQPLHKVASGGELSRISLALELVTHDYLETPCLVFDEVDVGISGKAGTLIGKALGHLGQSAQILCITHLPQVAAFANHHIQVIKTPHEKNTLTKIQTLDTLERIEEIARMLGGMDITEKARDHAKELLKLQNEFV